MARVRPGVELVRASLLPASELITLDLPTFDRPKKAISGNPGGGKCPGLEADNRNRERTRTLQCGGFEKKLQVDGDTKPECPLVVSGHIFRASLTDRTAIFINQEQHVFV